MLIHSHSKALRLSFIFLSIGTLILMQGCTSLPKSYTPLPNQLENQVQMPGLANVRAWGDAYSPALEKSAAKSLQQERAANHGKLQREVDGLALSGGGQDGAFGAGLICGWTESGTRPNFKLVTGISTGALMAPFAFLGPAYDAKLKEAYTHMSDRSIYKPHNPFRILLAILDIKQLPSLANDTGLEETIEQFVDDKMLKDIATEHLKGRRLFVGSTQLNAQRLVIWDMGAIASSGSPNALALFRQILLASASIPATFPPQYFTVEAGGQSFDEMHVDGGVETEVILFESAITPFANQEKIRRPRKLYVIRNQKVSPDWEYVKPDIKNIAIRSISSGIKSQGVSDLYRLYVYAERDHIDYNLAFMPLDFTLKPKTAFDNAYMNALFERGFELGRAGYPWSKYPPGFAP